jgi:hypothetical protein
MIRKKKLIIMGNNWLYNVIYSCSPKTLNLQVGMVGLNHPSDFPWGSHFFGWICVMNFQFSPTEWLDENSALGVLNLPRCFRSSGAQKDVCRQRALFSSYRKNMKNGVPSSQHGWKFPFRGSFQPRLITGHKIKACRSCSLGISWTCSLHLLKWLVCDKFLGWKFIRL